MAALLLVALIIVGSIALEREWIVITKEEEQSIHSKYPDPDTTKVNITFEKAKEILISTNSEIDNNSINGELINDSDYGIIWQLTSKTIYNGSIVAAIDSDDGSLLWTETTKGDKINPKYLNPDTTEVNVNLEEAKNILIAQNPDLEADSISEQLLNDDDYGIIWQLTSKTSNDKSIRIVIDPDDGNILYLYDASKKTRSDGNISEEEASSIAEKYMKNMLSADQLEEVQLKTVSYQEPVADDLPGLYIVRYRRIMNGIPSLSDGVTIRVNSETGDVPGYREYWEMSEEETYAVDYEAILTEEEAAEYLKEFIGNEVHDGKISETTEIISSELVWKYDENDEIRLAWWMQFTDQNLGLSESLPGLVIVDANTGEMLLASYEIG
jgi:hypothetical protein